MNWLYILFLLPLSFRICFPLSLSLSLSLSLLYQLQIYFIAAFLWPMFAISPPLPSWFSITRIRTHTHTHIHTHTYIYIYILEKNKNRSYQDYKFISILLWVLIWNNNTKNNWTSSYLMDKIIQNRHRKEGWEGVEEGWRVSSPFSPLPVFSFYYRLELQ